MHDVSEVLGVRQEWRVRVRAQAATFRCYLADDLMVRLEVLVEHVDAWIDDLVVVSLAPEMVVKELLVRCEGLQAKYDRDAMALGDGVDVAQVGAEGFRVL